MKLPSRSRGIARGTSPYSVVTCLGYRPLRRFGVAWGRPGAWDSPTVFRSLSHSACSVSAKSPFKARWTSSGDRKSWVAMKSRIGPWVNRLLGSLLAANSRIWDQGVYTTHATFPSTPVAQATTTTRPGTRSQTSGATVNRAPLMRSLPGQCIGWRAAGGAGGLRRGSTLAAIGRCRHRMGHAQPRPLPCTRWMSRAAGGQPL